MSTLNKLIMIILFMNLFMYIGVNFARSIDGYYLNSELKFHWKGDMIDTLMYGTGNIDDITQSTKENLTNYDINFTSDLVTIPDKTGGQSIGEGGISFLDSLDIAWSIIPTLFNIAVSPLTMFFNFRMPVIIGLMVGIPYFVLIIFSIFAFIRGASD